MRDIKIRDGSFVHVMNPKDFQLFLSPLTVYHPRLASPLLSIHRDIDRGDYQLGPEEHERGYWYQTTKLWNAQLSRAVIVFLKAHLEELDDQRRQLVEMFIEDEQNAQLRRRIEDFLRKNPNRIKEVANLLGLCVRP